MIRCFVSGVKCELKDAYVLNRRETRDLLDHLKDRVASLRRLMEQLSPLDDLETSEFSLAAKPKKIAPKKHRLVCKAVANAMEPGYPEIRLFLSWEQYQTMVRKTVLTGFREHPALSAELADVDDNALMKADKTGKRVLHLLDPTRLLPAKIRNAIALGAVMRLRGRSAEDIVVLIRQTATANGDAAALGLAPGHLPPLRALLQGADNPTPPVQVAGNGEVKQS